MIYAAQYPNLFGAAGGKFITLVLVLCALTACGSADRERMSPAPPPPHFDPATDINAPGSSDITLRTASALQLVEPQSQTALGIATDPPIAAGCRFKDRFDRSSALSYRFADNHAKLALNMSMDGLTPNRAMLRFSYKFQAIPKAKEKCLYNAPVQGVIGSVYNELVERDTHTVWQTLREQRANLLGR